MIFDKVLFLFFLAVWTVRKTPKDSCILWLRHLCKIAFSVIDFYSDEKSSAALTFSFSNYYDDERKQRNLASYRSQ